MFKNEKSHSPKKKWEHSTWSSLNWEKNVRHCPIEINWDSLHSQPERNIFNGSRPPVLLLPPPGVGRAGLGVEGEGVAGQTVPRQAAQHRLDGTVVRLFSLKYNKSLSLSSSLLSNGWISHHSVLLLVLLHLPGDGVVYEAHVVMRCYLWSASPLHWPPVLLSLRMLRLPFQPPSLGW